MNASVQPSKDILFLLSTGFEDGPGTSWFCPYCIKVEGMLACFPEIAERIQVRRIGFAKPRQEIVALLGEQAQGCPVVVLGEAHAAHPAARRSEATGRAYIADSDAILAWLAETFDTPRPHF